MEITKDMIGKWARKDNAEYRQITHVFRGTVIFNDGTRSTTATGWIIWDVEQGELK